MVHKRRVGDAVRRRVRGYRLRFVADNPLGILGPTALLSSGRSGPRRLLPLVVGGIVVYAQWFERPESAFAICGVWPQVPGFMLYQALPRTSNAALDEQPANRRPWAQRQATPNSLPIGRSPHVMMPAHHVAFYLVAHRWWAERRGCRLPRELHCGLIGVIVPDLTDPPYPSSRLAWCRIHCACALSEYRTRSKSIEP
jgi:hypothetical protein